MLANFLSNQWLCNEFCYDVPVTHCETGGPEQHQGIVNNFRSSIYCTGSLPYTDHNVLYKNLRKSQFSTSGDSIFLGYFPRKKQIALVTDLERPIARGFQLDDFPKWPQWCKIDLPTGRKGWRVLVDSEFSWTLFFKNGRILVDIFRGWIFVTFFTNSRGHFFLKMGEF
jgi:hypothetical protein